KEWNQMNPSTKNIMKEILIGYVQKSRWFRGKARKIKRIEIKDTISLETGKLSAYVVFIEIIYIEGRYEQYIIPLSVTTGDDISDKRHKYPEALIAFVEIDGTEGLIIDGAYDRKVRDLLFRLIFQKGKLRHKRGAIVGIPGKKLSKKVSKNELPLLSRILTADQSNTSVLYDNRFFFKLYRSPEEGNNPEMEIIRTLTENSNFQNFPAFSGALEYQVGGAENTGLGILVDFIPNEGNAWEFTQSAIDQFFDRIIQQKEELMAAKYGNNIAELAGSEKMNDLLGQFFTDMVALLGKRTAEMHLALASVKNKKEFTQEPFSLLYQKSLYQSFRTLIKRTFNQVKSAKVKLNDEQAELLNDILKNENELLSVIKKRLEQKKINTTKIRVHGDYHLGQVLFTGKDFIIIDFEGEPTRSITARKLKHCPFKDVAGMLRSFHYSINMGQVENESKMPESSDFLQPWLKAWYQTVQDIFLKSYLETAKDASFIPDDKDQLHDLLAVYTIEKAVYELDYEINNRPDWLHIPLSGLQMIMDDLLTKS
ncbi:MAG TPA: putative maltokinase, partial [Mariniphaga sp.]|nr:putative maltokinase [Mariniphaga sp.]